jgi:hypothetical protein
MNGAGALTVEQPAASVEPPWHRRLTGPWAAGVVLAGFWVLMLASLWHKGPTFDEPGGAVAGYTYWRFNDYRLDPENGNLPQRVMALPLVTGRYRFPPVDGSDWQTSEVWRLGYRWFFQMGNDAAGMLARGRAVSGLLAVALGALVWGWSRRLFGPSGGMVSLLLFVLNPGMLANGALLTTDTAASLFFLAALGAFWAMLHRLTPGRLLLSASVLGGLFVSKMSAPLIAPMALVLVGARLLVDRPLPVVFGPWRGAVAGRGRQALAFAAAGAVHVLVVALVIWGFYGFRYAAMANARDGRDRLSVRWELLLDKPDPLLLLDEAGLSAGQQAVLKDISQHFASQLGVWTPERLVVFNAIRQKVLTPAQIQALDAKLAAPPPTTSARWLDFLRRHHVLPEAYLYGQAYVLKFRGLRNAFLNGEVSVNGWVSFFPYSFIVKTPLPVFGVILLALAAAVVKPRQGAAAPGDPPAAGGGPRWYDALPLWTLLGCYWPVAILGHLNIGHRHILPTYAPLFVLCGAAAYWLQDGLGRGRAGPSAIRGRGRRAAGWILACLVIGYAAETFGRFPNYLAYFNAIAGGPAHGYQHLIDSSLDWGQDLPGVQRYLDQHRPASPSYLAYFGVGSPKYYLHPAERVRYLYSNPGHDVAPPLMVLELAPDKADAAVAEALRQLPDHELISRGRTDDNLVQVVLLKRATAFRLTGGTYFISASILQPVPYALNGPVGPWNERYEKIYQELGRRIQPLLSDDPVDRATALDQHSPSDWQITLNFFEMWRLARLTAYLRQREPDDSINYSILVYHLTDADLARALEGPPPELGPDITKDLLEDAK